MAISKMHLIIGSGKLPEKENTCRFWRAKKCGRKPNPPLRRTIKESPPAVLDM